MRQEAARSRSGVVVLVVHVLVVVAPAEDATAADPPAGEAARAEHRGAGTPHALVPSGHGLRTNLPEA